MIKITVTGTDCVQKKLTAISGGIPTADWREIGLGLRRDMQTRLDQGKDHNGAAFRKYGANTLAAKKKHGKSSIVNLQDSGNMRRQLDVKAGATHVDVLLSGDRREVGLKHQLGIGVPRREWFGYTTASGNKARKRWAELLAKRVRTA